MEEEASSMIGILEGTFRPSNTPSLNFEPHIQDQIPTKREETSRIDANDNFSKLGRSKTGNPPATDGHDLSNQARTTSKSKTDLVRPRRTGPERQTMVEKIPFHKKNSIVGALTGLLRKRSSVMPEPHENPTRRQGMIDEPIRVYGRNMIRVAQDEIIEHEDWNFDFGKIHIRFPPLMISPFGLFKKIMEYLQPPPFSYSAGLLSCAAIL